MTPKPPVPPAPHASRPSPSAASATDPVIGRPARAWVGRRSESPAPADDSFDALTDLFIGEVSPSRPATSTSTAAPASVGPARPVLRLAGDADDEPTAISTTPEPARVADPRPVRELGEPVVECLSLGNLPVLASAWASQYVREISAAAGRPVAVLRVQAGFASVDLIGEWAGEAAPLAAHPSDDLLSALRIAATHTDRWVIRCSTAEQRDLSAHPLIRVVTLLTGADEAAAAAAMQAVDTVRPGLPETDGPLVRLAVMGVVDDASKAAGRALAAAAEARLGRSVQQVVCSSKIRSARAPVSVFSGAVSQELPAIVEMLTGVLGVQPVAATPPSGVLDAPEITSLKVDPAPAPEPELEPEPVLQIVDQPGRTLDIALDDVPLPAAPAASRPFQQPPSSPAPVVEVRATTGATAPSLMPWLGEPSAVPVNRTVEPAIPADPEPALVPPVQPPAAAKPTGLHVHVRGLRATDIRCPYAAPVEFAVDDSGALHLLTSEASESKQDSALADLLVAASWASAHAALLGHRIASARPVMHVFTDQPKRSRRLLDTDVRVHVLAPVTVGTQTAWYCAELN